jgi:hypothetical protein
VPFGALYEMQRTQKNVLCILFPFFLKYQKNQLPMYLLSSSQKSGIVHPFFKQVILLICFVLLVIPAIYPETTSSIVIDGKNYTIDTLANFKVGPGSRYTSLRLQSNNRLDVYFLKVDATNPYVSFRAALGRDSIYTGEQPSALAKRKSKEGSIYFAGTNGDFYATSGYVGYPVSGCLVDYEIARVPDVSRKVIAFENDKNPFIGVMSYSGMVTKGTETWTLHTVNHIRNADQMVLFNQHNGKKTRTNAYGTEVLVELLPGQQWKVNSPVRVKVTKIEKNTGSMAIPKGMAVLSGHGTAAAQLNTLAVNDEIEIQTSIDNEGSKLSYSQMVGGDNRNVMLKEGVIETAQIWNELHPRTAIGYSQDQKTVIFCVVDGRGASVGVTTKQLAELMKSAGAWTAFNMDGGGSSSMYVKDFGPMNVPSDGTERAVSNSIFAVSSAPSDPVIAAIESYETTIRLPKFGVLNPKFLGYNQYGALINKEVPNVILSCDASTGYINSQGEFVFSGNNGKLTATYGNATTKVNVVLAEEAEIFIRLDSLLIDDYHSYPIEVQSQIGLNTMSVLPSALTWTVRNPSICKIEGGVLIGLQNGTTTIIGSLGSFNDSVRVKVEIPTEGRMEYETFSNTNLWTLTSSLTTWNTQFAPTQRPQAWEHGTAVQFTFQSARSPFLKLTRSLALYGLPDTIQLVINPGGSSFSSVIVGMKAATALTPNSVTFNSIGGTSDVKLSIPRTAFMNNPNDFANFPVKLEFLTFYLNSSNNTAGQTYTVGLKEIALRYGHITTSIDLAHTAKRFSIFPNPVNHSLLHISGPFNDPAAITVLGIDGKVLYQKTEMLTDTALSVANLPSGNYLLQLSSGGKTETHRFIKH